MLKMPRICRYSAILFVLLMMVLFVSKVRAMADEGSSETCGDTGLATPPPEKRLLTCLMANYDPAVRPVDNPKDNVSVQFDLIHLSIISLEEKAGILTSNGWILKTWIDKQLTWNPKDYGDVESIRIPTNRIWTPDIVLYNNAADKYSYVVDRLAVVLSNGTVYWVPHAKFHSYCKLDLARFPFDTQVCVLVFGSWTYDSTKMDLRLSPNRSDTFSSKGAEWNIINEEAKRHVLIYSKDIQFPALYYTITMQRNDMFQQTMFVGPAVMMALLIIFMFTIPPQAGERIGLGVGIIISCSLFLTLLDQHLPTETAHMPLMGMYFIFDFVMVTLAIVISTGVLNFYHRGNKRNTVPNWMRSLFLQRLGRLCCVPREAYTSVPSEPRDVDLSMRLDEETNIPLPQSPTLALEKVLEEIRNYMKMAATRANSPDDTLMSHQQLIVNEWHQLALIFDRLLFWCYVVVSVLVTIVMMSH